MGVRDCTLVYVAGDISTGERVAAGTGGCSPGGGSTGGGCTAGVPGGPTAGATCGWFSAGGP